MNIIIFFAAFLVVCVALFYIMERIHNGKKVRSAKEGPYRIRVFEKEDSFTVIFYRFRFVAVKHGAGIRESSVREVIEREVTSLREAGKL